MDEELDNLFADVFKPQGEPKDQPADDDGKQEQKETGEPEKKEEENTDESAERSRNAQRRQRREARIADEARKAERARLDELLKGVGIEREDGSTIDSTEALEAFYKAQSDERIAQGRANAQDIRRIAQEAMKPSDKSSADVDKELEMIREMDPALTDLEPKEVLEEILKSDLGDSFRKQVNAGATFIQAYGRAVRERNALAEGAKNADAAKAAGKGHLGATKQRGDGGLTVPASVKSIWKALNPDDSDEEIQKYYNKDRKRFG